MATATTPTAIPASELGFTPAFKRVAQQRKILTACLHALPCWPERRGRSSDNGNQTIQASGTWAVLYRRATCGISLRPLPIRIDRLEGGDDSDIRLAGFSDIDDRKYNATLEQGRSVLFHRMRPSNGPKPVIEYVVDPAPWVPPQMQIRVNLKSLMPSWVIAVHPMNAPATYSKK